MNALPRDMKRVIWSFLDIIDVINVLDAGAESDIIAEVLPIISVGQDKDNIEHLIHNLINRNNYHLIKCLFNFDMHLISNVIIFYIVQELTEVAERLIRMIPDNYDWGLYNMDGAFQGHCLFETEILRELRPALTVNCLPLLDIILKEYDNNVHGTYKQKLEDLEEVKEARIKISIYNLSKYWNNGKDLYDNDKINKMNDLLMKMKELEL